MTRLAIIRGGVTMVLMLGIVIAVASSADASSGQLRVYMHKGLSLERAQVALATQSSVEAVELPPKLEKALGASFAGVWFEPSTGKFCIGVVSNASRHVAERVVAQVGLASVVSYVSVRSTWAQLIGTKGEWNLKLAPLGGRQFSTGLTASDNAVSVTLSSSVPAHERTHLEREAADSHVNVSITVVPLKELVIRPNNSQCEFKVLEAYCSKPIAAGVLITTLNTAKPTHRICTAGPLAILSNPATSAARLETFIITAGHCTEGTTSWFTSTHPGKEAKEIGPTVTALDDLFGDYGSIAVGPNWLEAGTTPALAQITHYLDNGLREALNVVGEAASVQNASFCKQGAKSAEQCGTITGVDRLVLFGSQDVDGLVVTKSCGEKGDSGGPYATLPEGNSVRILGTEIGSPEQTCSGLFCGTCSTDYEPIRTSLTALGLTLLTTANQTRHQGGRFLAHAPGTLEAKALTRQKFTAGGLVVECEKLKALNTAALQLVSETQHATIDYEKCTAAGVAAVVTPMLYLFHSNGSLDLLGHVTITGPGCTVLVKPKSGLTTVTYRNLHGAISIEGKVTGILSEGKGIVCEFPEESKGTYEGTTDVWLVSGGTLLWD